MATMTENVIDAGAKNRPPMLEKGMYNSWKTRIWLYIQRKDNVYIYTLVNHYQTVKEICDRVKELMEGTELTLQELESKLYDEFDRFTSEPGETIHSYYWRYAKLINDINIIKMTMSNIQVNMNFLNNLQLEWSRFVINAKQEKDLHKVNFDQLYWKGLDQSIKDNVMVSNEVFAFLEKFFHHDFEKQDQVMNIELPKYKGKEGTIMDYYDFVSDEEQVEGGENFEFNYDEEGLVVPSFLPTDNPITSLNKAMMFLSTAMNSRFPPTQKDFKSKNSSYCTRWPSYCLEYSRTQINQGQSSVTIAKEDHVDAFDSDCDDEATACAIFMASLSLARSINGDTVGLNYDSDIIFEVPHYDTYHETKNDATQYVPPPKQDNAMILFVIEQMKSQVELCNTVNQETMNVNESLSNYALWEIIEDGNSFKPVARTTTNADRTSTSTIPGAVTAEEKIQKKNDLKAQSILMMTLPSEHLLTFNQYKDAKTLFEAIEARFGESLDSIFIRLQKIVRQLAILGENISQEDLNFKFLRSLRSEWSMHVVNVAFVSTPSSTDDVNTSNVHVSIASSSLSTAISIDNTARLSDATIYAFLAINQICLRKFYQRTGKKIIINGSDIAGYDKTKVECFNCHKMGHFTRECRNPRSQENRSRNQDSLRRTMNVEEFSSKAMLAIDGVRFDWSFMTKEEMPINFALMAFLDSEVHNNKTFFKTCLKSFEDLKSQYNNLRIELNKSKLDLANYKRGLASVEEQLVFYKKNEERLKKEKESNQIKIDNFENASKILDKLIGCQISDNNRKGVGYNAVAPPPTGLFAPPTIDLSNSGLEEFKQPEFGGYEVKVNKSVSENSSNEIKKTSGASIIEDWVSDCDEDETLEKVSKSANVQKLKQADQPRKISQNPRNNSTN
ncbi:ribonuclease H-like domain-containing protein [Tanacetum coccineum]